MRREISIPNKKGGRNYIGTYMYQERVIYNAKDDGLAISRRCEFYKDNILYFVGDNNYWYYTGQTNDKTNPELLDGVFDIGEF